MSGYRFDRLRILVVDDSVHMRQLVIRMLQGIGVTAIHEAESGERAWEIVCEVKPDLVVMDCVMNGMSGLDVVRLIRTDSRSPNFFLPVVVLTAYASAERIAQARDAGVNEFLVKPISAKEIMEKILAAVEHPRPFVRTNAYFGPCRRRRRDSNYRGPERRAKAQTQKAPG